ncbi:MAG: RHS repeat-associated core domain-containing protein, partial [Acidimicrobiales bacterium]
MDLWTNTGAPVTYNGNTVIAPASFATHRHAVYNTSGGVTSLVNTLASSDSNLFSSVAFGYETSTGCAGTPANANTDQIRFEYDSVTSLLSAFCYDQAGRLSVANLEGTVTTYGYDTDGNLSSGSLGTFTNNTADQITNSGFSFDADGNLTATPTLTLAYNGADQTTSVTPAGQSATSLAYSGAGQDLRLTSSGPSGTTTFANGALGIESQTSTSAGITKFVTLPDGSPICESTPTGDYYYLTDIMGSAIGLVTPSGTARAKYSYTPYGSQTATALNGALPSNPYGFDGGYLDATGLVHFGARYYDPMTGQWTQLDPLGFDAGYVFVGDDPIDLADPSGTSGGLMGEPPAVVTCANMAQVARLPQDVAVNPNPPPAMPLRRPVSKSATQNKAVQTLIIWLRKQGADKFRVNQQQVNVDGERVGTNR